MGIHFLHGKRVVQIMHPVVVHKQKSLVFLAECSCEEYQYSLATGQLLNPPEDTETLYPLLFYRAEVRGNSVVISN